MGLRRIGCLSVMIALALPSGALAQAKAQAPTPAPAPAPLAPALSPLDAYAEAAATTILAEQNCPGFHLFAGRLTSLRLAAKVAPAQEAALTEKLRGRASALRERLVTEGQSGWCASALAAFGPEGSVARGVLTNAPFR